MAVTSKYSANDVEVLKGLKPVQVRPDMYTRTEDPLHIIQEVIDNAVDEALAGFCRRIDVRLLTDGGIEVVDDGRGIPVELHKEEGKPAIELVFTHLHAGGKFKKSVYRHSGGLHGVGVSVTNALSKRLEVEVWRGKRCYHMAFEHGEIVETLSYRRTDSPRRGTCVRFWPDPQYFDSPKIPFRELEALLRAKAVLLPSLTVTLTTPDGEIETWYYDNGMPDYLSEQMTDKTPVSPIFQVEGKIETDETDLAADDGAAVVLAWVEETGSGESYVNLINTPQGGTHINGLRQAVVTAVRNFATHHSLLPRGIKLAPEDIWGNVCYVLSASLSEPRFVGQTKDKLANRDAAKVVERVVLEPLELWLNDHLDVGKQIAQMAIRAAERRQRAAKRIEKRSGGRLGVLPGKLVDCTSKDPRERELFLVEGDSAGGSAKESRDKDTQALLPLRGKIDNTWETTRDRLFSNQEIHDIAVSIGVDPHDLGDEVNLSGLRYHRIVILADADVDGSHIQVLLLTLFFRHFPKLIENGHIFVACPPLYRVEARKGKKRFQNYVADNRELEAVLRKLRRQYGDAIEVSRFKGLGEMNPQQLWETTLNPDTRRMLQIRVDDWETVKTVFNDLMAKKRVERRRQLLEERGNKVDLLHV